MLEFAKVMNKILVKIHLSYRYVNYGSGAKRFPLQDVLQYTLEFANSRSPDPCPGGAQAGPSGFSNNNSNIEDVEMTSPPRSLNNSPTPG